eukprot:g8720.t1
MASRIITTVLQNYCGRYLDGISEENIEASVWSGEVSLKNLSFKPNALDFLDLPVPVTVRKGFIGSLDILMKKKTFLAVTIIRVLRAKIQILSPKVIFPLAANHNVVMNLGYVKATYGNSADAPSLKLINLSIGHLEIDDSPYIGTKFHKLATSNSTDSDDLIYTVCTVDYMEQHVSIGIKFEELALQWNPDTINALLNQFFQSSEDGTARGKVVRENVYEDGSIEVEPVEESSVTQVTNDWNTKVDVKMKELSLTLNKEKIGLYVPLQKY